MRGGARASDTAATLGWGAAKSQAPVAKAPFAPAEGTAWEVVVVVAAGVVAAVVAPSRGMNDRVLGANAARETWESIGTHRTCKGTHRKTTSERHRNDMGTT